MREVVGKSLRDFQQSPIDPATVPFKHDEEREQQRQQQLQDLNAKREDIKKAKEKKKLKEAKEQQKLLACAKKQKRTTSEKRHAKK